jgi:hypothetical protein
MNQTVAAVRTEDLIRDAMAPGLAPAEQQTWLEDAASCFRRHGVISIRDSIPRDAVNAVLEHVKVRHDAHLAPGQKKLYRNLNDDPKRGLSAPAIDGPLANPAFFAAPSVLGLARKLAGEKVIVGELGLVVSHAGAEAQAVHRDSTSIFGGPEVTLDLPPFSMNVLIPLVDVSLGMGPTEFWPGSHRNYDRAAATAGPPHRIPLNAGSVLMIDSRLLHRGGANVDGPVRPLVYFSFHRPWYLETSGYENRPQVRVTPSMLQRLPEEYRPLFSWALHLNRTDSFQEFAYRWLLRFRRQLV